MPLQSIRDYLGHDYEEMTEQYIDYMPKKIEKASEEYFSQHSLVACLKRGEKQMDNRIYLWDLYDESEKEKFLKKQISRDPYYDLEPIPSTKIREEVTEFIRWRSTQVCMTRLYNDLHHFKKLCRFLQECTKSNTSLHDRSAEAWIRQFEAWMFKEQVPLYKRRITMQGKILMVKVRDISYLERLLKYLSTDNRREEEKDIWEVDKLDIQFRANPIKRVNTLNFTKILQDDIRQGSEKRYLPQSAKRSHCLHSSNELTAVRRLSLISE